MNAAVTRATGDLERRLAEAQATIKALVSGEVDAVVDSRTGTPLLLFNAQDALRESVERYRILFDNSPFPKWLYDVKTHRFLAVNDAASSHYGYSRAQFLEMTLEELCPPEELGPMLRDLADDGAIPGVLHVHRHKKKDGSIIEVEVVGHTFPLKKRMTRLIVAQDVTERRRTESALRASEEQMRLLLDSTGEGIYGVDLQGSCTFANAACLELLGYRQQSDLLGRTMHEAIHHTREDGSPYPVSECHIYAALAGEEGRRGDEVLWRADGSSFPADVRCVPLCREGARIGGVVSFTDISARRKAEETLRWLAAIVESSTDAIIGADPAGMIISWNASAERLYGYAAAEVLGKPFSILASPSDDGFAATVTVRALAGEVIKDLETICVRKDGSRVAIALSLDIIRDASGKVCGISGINRDITQRRAAEEQLGLLHNVIAAGETSTLYETLNVALRLIGQATGVPIASAWIPVLDKLEVAGTWVRHEGSYRQLAEGFSFEKGSGLPGRAWQTKQPVSSAAADLGPRSAIAASLGLGSALAVPIMVGDELAAVLETFLPLGEHEERLLGLLSAVGMQLGSVLRRRRAEEALRKSEEQLRQSQKMEAIGQLTGGVAHDFNNLLSVILSYSQLLAEGMQANDPRREDLAEISNAGLRAAELTHQLLAFSRRQVLQPRVVDLNQIVGGMKTMLQRLMGEDVELTTLYAPEQALVHVDAGQMEQVIMNLVVNARDAMPAGGKMTIEISHLVLDAAFVAGHDGAAPGPNVMLTASDTGSGMDAATQARAFEPFFTTKEQGKGTGLGLATVFGIVRQSAGTIWIESAPGKGTAFKICLPVAGPDAGTAVTPPALEPAGLRGAETVLLVEDEEGIRKLARSILQRNGYRVLEAADGADAIRIGEEHAQIDLLLTDVVMPRISGAETAARLVAMHPELKVLYMSGYTDNAVILHGVLREEAAFVQKPITPTVLLAKVRLVLDSP